MANRPTISILMAVYNQRPYVSRAIESVLAQTSDDWELIVVDDGSNDGTKEVLQEISDPRIHIYRLSRNMGKAYCLDEALARSTGQYLLELDGDDWLDPDAVEQLVEITKNWPAGAAFIYGNVRLYIQRHSCPMLARILKGKPYSDRHEFLINCDFFAPRLWRKQAVESVGGWPTESSGAGRIREAHRLAVRLLADYQFAYKDFTVYNYRKHPNALRVRFSGRQTWEAKKQDIIDALKLWKSPYTPFFDDFMQLIFLRPDKADRIQDSNEAREQLEARQVSDSSSSRPNRQKPLSGRQTARPVFGREVVPTPTIVDLTKDKTDRPDKNTHLEQWSDSIGRSFQRGHQLSGRLPRLAEIGFKTEEPKMEPLSPEGSESTNEPPPRPDRRPFSIRLPGFPVGNLSRPSQPARPIPKPQPVYFPRSQAGSRQDYSGAQKTAYLNNGEPSGTRAWSGGISFRKAAFYPIGTVGEPGQPGGLQTRYAALFVQYLAQTLEGMALPVDLRLRQRTDGHYGATYVESPAFIHSHVRQTASSILSSGGGLLVVVPGLPTPRAAQLLNSALNRETLGIAVVVVNVAEVLSSLGLSREQILAWPERSIPFLSKALGLTDEEPDEDLSEYYAKLVERIRTHIKLVFKRTEVRLTAKEGEPSSE